MLAVFDGSPAATNAAWRAALVARDHRVPLRVLHAPAAGAEAAGRHGDLVDSIRHRLNLAVESQALGADTLGEIVRAARQASLLVLGARRGNLLREFILGTQAERLVRLCRMPVLVVKRPATGGYRRVLVAVDLGPDAGRVIAAATAFSRDPRMEVLHALSTHEELAMRVADVPVSVVRRQRARAMQRAHGVLEELIAFAGAEPQGALPSVAFGEAGAAVLARERALRAELVVVGKRRQALLADFFLGGVTQRVLAGSRADVLVLPVPARESAGVRLRAQPSLRTEAPG